MCLAFALLFGICGVALLYSGNFIEPANANFLLLFNVLAA